MIFKMLFFSLFSFNLLYAQEFNSCLPAISLAEIESIKEEVRADFFPDLQVPINVELFRSKNYFLQANFPAQDVFSHALDRQYRIQVNKKLLPCPPSYRALRAILTHELKHIADYAQLNPFHLVEFLVNFQFDRAYRKFYERSTDEFTLLSKQSNGLKEYRIWVYERLSPRAKKVKQKMYYTPEQIDQWVNEHPQ